MMRVSTTRLRFGDGDDAPPVAAVRLHRPAALGRQPLRGRLVVDRPDELRRVGERRIGGGHQGLVDDRRDLPAGQRVLQRLHQPVADHALGLRAEHVQRVGPCQGRVGRALQREHADLGTVAVGDDELVPVGQRRERLHGRGALARWVVGLGLLAAFEQGVAADRDDDPHRSPAQRGDHDGLDRVHAVLGLVEHDRVRRLEHLVGDLQRVQAGVLVDLLADLRAPVVERRAGSA